MEKLDMKLKSINGGKVLDIATGRGEFIRFVKEFNGYDSIIAVDTDKRFEEPFKRQFPEDNIKFAEMDAKKLDFDDCTFDTVCMSNSLHHLEHREDVLKEMWRVLKPGGNLIINEMVSNNLNESQKTHRMIHHFWAKLDRMHGVFHDDTYSSDKITGILENFASGETDVIEYSFPIENPKDPEMLKSYGKILEHGEKRIEMMKESEQYEELKTEFENVKNQLEEFGYAPATSMFIVKTK